MDFTYNSNQIALLGEDDKLLAEVTFPEIDKDTVNIDHTFVDPSLRGAESGRQADERGRRAIMCRG